MKNAVLLVAMLFASTILTANDNTRFELDFQNVKYKFNDIPKINLYIGPDSMYKFNLVIKYANNLFINYRLQDQDYKVHNIQLAMNYKF